MALETLPDRIVRYPDPRLRREAEPIEEFGAETAALVERMYTLMREGDGVGLAAPQVGLSLRMFVCNPTGQPDDNRVYINPELLELTGAVEAEEGCLSLPDVQVSVRRAKFCRIRAMDAKGMPFEEEGEDLLARIWQHENDHLDGRLIIDRMNGTDQIANKKILAQLEEDYRKASRRR